MRTNTDMTGLGIQSLETGLGILKEIARADMPLSITEISERCSMPKSKLHRYLTSLYRSGFLKRDVDLRYSLGTELYSIGLKSLNNLDIRNQARPALIRLREQLNETIALSVWTEAGPHYLHWEESLRAVNIGIRVGSQVSALKSAGGLIFLAYLPKEETEHVLLEELSEYGADRKHVEENLSIVREKGYAVTEGSLLPGILSIGCPVFDRSGTVVAAVTVVGIVGFLDASDNSQVVTKLKQACSALSKAIV